MLGTMNAGSMARACRSYLKVHDVKSSRNPDPEFISRMMRLCEESEKASGTGGAVRISPKDLTMEEYKEYIYNRISQIPLHPTNMQDTICVQITDEGFAAMKEDAEYEKWVLDSVKSNFSSYDPWSGMCGGKYVILHFGASKEQSRGESWRAGYLNGSGNKLFNQKAKDGFWERRVKRHRELAEQYEEFLEKKELNEDLMKGLYYGSLAVLNAFKPKAVKQD